MLREDLQPLGHIRAHVAEQDAVRLLRAASDAAAELMELREPESLRVLDEHHRRVRHVDAHLDHRRRDEQVDLAVAKPAHDVVALFARDAAVQQRDAPVRERPGGERLVHRRRGLEVGLLRFLDHRIDDVRLTSQLQLSIDELQHARARRFLAAAPS